MSSSSKKRKFDNLWSIILNDIPEIEESVKSTATEGLHQHCITGDFITYNDILRNSICKLVGLTGWGGSLK
jgi:hypothetical protein